MHQVDITYRAGIDGPPGGAFHRAMPSRWQDLTPDQAWHCMDMVIRGCRRTEIVEYLLQLPAYIHQRLQPGEIYDLLRLITWMDIDAQSTAPIAPYIDIAGTRMYLPTAQFASVSCLEYVLIDELYSEYITALDTELEMRLAALTLRPAGPSSDPASDPRTQLLSAEQTQEWMHLVRQLPESLRIYIITLISANRALVHTQYAHWLFTSEPPSPSDDEGNDEIDTQPTESGLNFGWWGAYLDVAADAVFGTYDQVLHTAFHTVCMHMVRKVEAARLRRQEMDHAHARSLA